MISIFKITEKQRSLNMSVELRAPINISKVFRIIERTRFQYFNLQTDIIIYKFSATRPMVYFCSNFRENISKDFKFI